MHFGQSLRVHDELSTLELEVMSLSMLVGDDEVFSWLPEAISCFAGNPICPSKEGTEVQKEAGQRSMSPATRSTHFGVECVSASLLQRPDQ